MRPLRQLTAASNGLEAPLLQEISDHRHALLMAVAVACSKQLYVREYSMAAVGRAQCDRYSRKAVMYLTKGLATRDVAYAEKLTVSCGQTPPVGETWQVQDLTC